MSCRGKVNRLDRWIRESKSNSSTAIPASATGAGEEFDFGSRPRHFVSLVLLLHLIQNSINDMFHSLREQKHYFNTRSSYPDGQFSYDFRHGRAFLWTSGPTPPEDIGDGFELRMLAPIIDWILWIIRITRICHQTAGRQTIRQHL